MSEDMTASTLSEIILQAKDQRRASLAGVKESLAKTLAEAAATGAKRVSVARKRIPDESIEKWLRAAGVGVEFVSDSRDGDFCWLTLPA